jgi:hypothetical protein
LPQLWYDGAWTGLASAAAFALVLNGLLAVTLVWNEAAAAATKWAGWTFVALFWVASAAVSYRWLGRRAAIHAGETPRVAGRDLYPAALDEYLKRNYVEAERLLLELVTANERDVPAGLMLATLWRRTDRAVEARQELARLSRLDAAADWRLEIERELALLDVAETRDATSAEKGTEEPNQAQAA